jgi:hypothetical protein
VKLGYFTTVGMRVRAASLAVWLLFLWVYPVALRAISSPEDGHACCRRSKHSCCKKTTKGYAISSRSCGMSCPAMSASHSKPVPVVASQAVEHVARTIQLTPRAVESDGTTFRTFSPTQFQRPPPRS